MEPLVDADYLLEKFPGKGGWTYAAIPEVLQDKHAWFGWVAVRGSIDNYQFDHQKLMPMGNGQLFLPVKAAVRKLIGKEAGDTVRVRLWPASATLPLPEVVAACFELQPAALAERFRNLPASDQKRYLDWISAARSDDEQADRMAAMMNDLDNISDPKGFGKK